MNAAPDVMSDYFANTGDTFYNYMAGWCGPLTHAVSSWLKQRGISHKRLLIVRGDEKHLYPTAKGQPNAVWYHAIIVVNDLIHCPWLNERLSVEAYCEKMFPGQKVIVGENYSRFTAKETLH